MEDRGGELRKAKERYRSASSVLIFDVTLIGILYNAYPDGCQHRLHVLLRLRPYPVRVHQLL